MRHLNQLSIFKLLASVLNIPLRDDRDVELFCPSGKKSKHWKKIFWRYNSCQPINFFSLLNLPYAGAFKANSIFRTSWREQKRTLTRPNQNKYCIRFFDSGQIVEIGSLAKFDWIDLLFGSEDHGDAVRDFLEQLRSPCHIFTCIERLLSKG